MSLTPKASFQAHQSSTHHLYPTNNCKRQGKTSRGTFRSTWTTPSSITTAKSMHRPPYPDTHDTNRVTYSYPSYHHDNYLAGDGKSHVFRGPGWYVPSERRWEHYHEHKVLPPEAKRDAIEMEDEEQWRDFQKKRDEPKGLKHFSKGVPPQYYYRIPADSLMATKYHSWVRPWTGSGFHVPSTDSWLRELPVKGLDVPAESRLYWNEEDWTKFKYRATNPELKMERSQTLPSLKI